MWSKYLRVKEKEGIVAIFHELHPDPLYFEVDQWFKIKNQKTYHHDNGFVGKLREKKLIIDTPQEDIDEFEKVNFLLEKKLNNPTILYLMTSQGCNLSCKYCPIPKIKMENGNILLSERDAILGIDLWQKHLKDIDNKPDQYYVIFYGGEPLLNVKTIVASLKYLRKQIQNNLLPKETNFMIATNGVLIDEDIVNICKEYSVMVTIGLDGPKEINDILRVDNNGYGTYDRVIKSIKLLIDNGIPTFASVSITPFNIDLISNFSSFFEKIGVNKFGFNFLKGRALLEIVGDGQIDEYYQKASSGVINNFRNQTIPNFEYQMERKLQAFEDKDFYPVDCTCYGNQLVVQPDGQISNCPFHKSNLGQVESISSDFRIWQQPIVKEWRKNLPLYFKGEAKALSGGGCTWSLLDFEKSFSHPDKISELFSEEVLNEFIWRRYSRQS